MKRYTAVVIFLLLMFALFSCRQTVSNERINSFMDNWHLAASNADADVFFGSMADDAVYLGTQADEHWTKAEFVEFAKPYFDRGKAWCFKPITRNVYSANSGNLFWFDESLQTWMGICRGSGVIQVQNDFLKILQYNLTVTISNNLVHDFVELVKKDSINQFLLSE